jgi:hypothetical protein
LHAASPIQRQQIKWLLYGFVPAIVLPLCLSLYMTFVPSLNQPGAYLFNTPHSFLMMVALPLYRFWYLPVPFCVGIALLRYRLWDIDTLINKTLVYGSLTALLAGVYAGLIICLESLAGLISGQAASNPPVLVVSTLAIAALFVPVRRRIQALIDRRFYRRKYDAEKTLAAFSSTLRNEVDLIQVREQLLGIVEETMQPAHVSLWLRSPERRSTDGAQRLEPPADGPEPPRRGLNG